uniref:Uncharacterized protein n=1 Tax=Zea mays TaxID=4577 RepID=C0PAR2_MAIZE|nr:unknown [Zea mays]
MNLWIDTNKVCNILDRRKFNRAWEVETGHIIKHGGHMVALVSKETLKPSIRALILSLLLGWMVCSFLVYSFLTGRLLFFRFFLARYPNLLW